MKSLSGNKATDEACVSKPKPLQGGLVNQQECEEMKKKIVKKLWQGKFCSVRDYEVRDAIKKGGLELQHDNQIMRLNVNELRQLKPTGKPIQSKFKGSYHLIDITFKPLTEDVNQQKLF